jgi:hypothetical protein
MATGLIPLLLHDADQEPSDPGHSHRASKRYSTIVCFLNRLEAELLV